MTDLIKLDMTQIWATNGDKTQPSDAKIQQGWVVEAVPRQTWNWFENRQDQNIAYMLQKGIPEWDTTTEYIVNKSYVQRNNIVYKCIQTGTNQDPAAANSTYWRKAFTESSAYLELIRDVAVTANTFMYVNASKVATNSTISAYALTLLDDADAATARTTLGAQALNTNLTALSGVTPITNGLPYFTSTSAMAVTNFTGFARTLLDDVDAATMRATLGLGTTAVANLTVGNADGTSGRVTTVGDYGWGTGNNGLPAMDPPSNGTVGDLNLATLSGVYRVSSTTANVAAGFSQGALVITLMWNNATGAQIITQNGSSAMRGGSNLATTPTWTNWLGTWNTNNLVKTTGAYDTTAGSMLKVGDFGWGALAGAQSNIAASTNLNTIQTSGAYAQGSNANATLALNYPVASKAGTLLVLVGGVDITTQIYFEYDTGQMWTRARFTTTWTPWALSVTSANQQTVIDLAVAAAVAQAATSAANLYVAKTGSTMTGSLVIDTGASGNASIELGNKARNNTPFIDFNSSAGGSDYDARIIASGGNATIGQGNLQYNAKGGHFFNTGAITATDGFFGNLTGTVVGSVSGNANTATALQTARTISLSGGASGSVSFNGTANVAIPVTIAISGVTGLQSALDGKLAATDISANYYNKTQTDGRYPLGSNAYLNISNGSVPTISGASDSFGASNISIHNGGNNSASAVMSFVRDGSFGTWFGLDTDNELAWGGWSHGNVRYRIWSERNFNPNLYVTAGAFGSTLVAASSTGVPGSYAMLVNTSGSNVGPGGTLATGLTYASTTSNAGGAAGGTWRAMGNGNNNGTTLWLRIA